MLNHKKKNNLLQFLIVGLFVIFAGHAGAEPLAPQQQLINDTSEKLQALIKDETENLNDINRVREIVAEFIEPNVDFHRISSAIVGRKHWRSATDDQKARFKKEFKEKLIRTYAKAFDSFDDWSIRYLPIRTSKNNKYVTVKTQVLRSGGAPAVSVDYKMYDKKGKWLIFDVSIEGISVVTNYQKTIKRELRQAKGSLESVIQKLAEKNARPIEMAEAS